MTDQPAPAPSVGTPKKAASVGGQAVGIVGIVVCLALAVGVLVGRGWLVTQVDAVIASVDDQLAKGIPLLAQADTAVTQVSATVTDVGDAATAVTNATNPAPALVQGLSAKVSAVSERYLPLRAAYADARANVVSTLDRLQTLDRLVPGVSVPQGPVDAVASLDTAIRTVDSSVMLILGANTGAKAAVETAAVVAETTPKVEAALADVQTRLGEAEARLGEVRTQLADTGATIDRLITVVSLVLILALLYVAFLHFVLFRSAGGVRKAKPPAA